MTQQELTNMVQLLQAQHKAELDTVMLFYELAKRRGLLVESPAEQPTAQSSPAEPVQIAPRSAALAQPSPVDGEDEDTGRGHHRQKVLQAIREIPKERYDIYDIQRYSKLDLPAIRQVIRRLPPEAGLYVFRDAQGRSPKIFSKVELTPEVLARTQTTEYLDDSNASDLEDDVPF